jgi:rhodanese-related sulfurtransferase
MVMRSGGNEVKSCRSDPAHQPRGCPRSFDVREADEFAAGHLPEAKHFPLSKLSERIGELEKFKDKPIIVCCATGMRSGKACGEFTKQGFQQPE